MKHCIQNPGLSAHGDGRVVLLDVSSERRDAAWRVQQKACDMTVAQECEALLNRRLEATNTALLATQRELEALEQDP